MNVNKEAINQFTGGLMMDLNPMVTPNNVLTGCLNGTYITFNGNEHVLLTDMGNGRVETALLPEGYIPIGTCSHGGFVYIVSYNPLRNLALIGSFPSPERNIDTTELSDLKVTLSESEFYTEPKITIDSETIWALNPLIRKVFENVILNPGDKFIVFANNLYTTNLSDYGDINHQIETTIKGWNIRIGSLEESGKVTELDNLKWYDNNKEEDNKRGDYYIKCTDISLAERGDKPIDVDEYRSLVNSAYSVFSPKKSGQLCLLIRPEMIDGFATTISVYPSNDLKDPKSTSYDVFLGFSWSNGGKDINPYRVIIDDKSEEKIKVKDLLITFNTLSVDDFKKDHPDLNEHFINFENGNLQQYKNSQFIHAIYENGVPVIDSDNKQKHFIAAQFYTDPGGTIHKINGEPVTVGDWVLNNYFKTDTIYKIGTVTVPNEIPEGSLYYILNIDTYPCMLPGYLAHLKNSVSYDFSKIGSGIKMTKWKYYVQEKSMFVNWQLDAYTLPGEKINEVWLEFYDNQGLCAIQSLKGLSSYHGEFQTSINLDTSSEYHGLSGIDRDGNVIKHFGEPVIRFDEISDDEKEKYYDSDNNLKPEYVLAGKDEDELFELEPGMIYVNNSGTIYKNALYLVTIKYSKSKINTFNDAEPVEETLCSKWLWTTRIFNEKYETENDFDNLNPTLQLDLNVQYVSNDNYQGLTYNVKNGVEVSTNQELQPPSERVSANLLYVRSLNDKDGNINARVLLLLEDNYDAYALDQNELDSIDLIAFDGTNGDYSDQYFDLSIALPKIILEYSNNETNREKLLQIINTDDDLTAGINEQVWNTLIDHPSIGHNGDLSDIPNVYNLSVCNTKLINEKITYITSAIDSNTNTQVTKTLNAISGAYQTTFEKIPLKEVPLNFKAIHYSKYYTNGKVDTTRQIPVCTSPISSKEDFAKYNLVYSNFNNEYYKGAAFKYVLVVTTDYKGDNSDKFRVGVFKVTYTQSDVSILEHVVSEKTEKGVHNWTLKYVLENSADAVDTITKMSLFTPVCNVNKEHYTEGGNRYPGLYRGGSKNNYKGENMPRLCFNNVWGTEDYGPCWPTSTIKWSSSNKIVLFGGVLGVSLDDNTLQIDYNHILTAPNTMYNDKWYQEVGQDGLRNFDYNTGCIFTYYAQVLLGILTQLYYKTNRTNNESVISYDNYTYYEPYLTYFTRDMVYRAKVELKSKSDNEKTVNDLVVINGRLKLQKYVDDVISRSGVEEENIGKKNCINFKIEQCVKTFPIKFTFDYITPELKRNDFSNKCLIKSLDKTTNGKLVTCEDDVLYTFNLETGNLLELNSGSIFTATDCDSEYNLHKNLSSKKPYQFTLPMLCNYLYVNNGTLAVNSAIKNYVQYLPAQYNIRGHEDRRIENLTAFNFIQFTGDDNKPLDSTL